MRPARTPVSVNGARRGLAMIAVLLVLMALFVLSAPFLVTVRNADQASGEQADRATLRIVLDSAARHGAARLSGSHPALDPTPYHDDLEELTVSNVFAGDFLATVDPRQVMWTAEAEDVAARVDLASASPHVLANLIGGVARLGAACKDSDTSLEVSGTEGFQAEGVVYLDDELVGYAELGPSSLGRLTRGLLVLTDAEGTPTECGPSPAKPHDVGAYVLDQRAFALCEWRIATGTLRAFEGLEELREAGDFMLAPEFGREAYLALERTASTFGHVRAGARWQRAARVVADPSGEPQYGCRLALDDARWFNAGTTVRITDGDRTEYALVRTVAGNALVLMEPLKSPFRGQETTVAPLARAPVNVNTAGPEVLAALWTNLKLRGRSARITAGEAEKLVDLALVSRPFTGFEDFLVRFVLPAGGLDELPADAPVRPQALEELAREATLDAEGKKALRGLIDPDDARALYKNALNANDGELEFSTMPLCFTSRDVYSLSLRASVNAPSGLERARGQRELSELIVPQRDLLTVLTRQVDFDDAPRLSRAAAGWMSGPVPTARPDPIFGEIASLRWPTRTRAHLGPHDTVPSLDPLAAEDGSNVYSFAEREEEDGWVQLAPYREDDAARKASYALHFDDETKVLEGRYLPDGLAPLDLAELGWSGSGNLMRGMAFSMWIQPRGLEEGALLLDVAGRYTDADRLSLLIEDGDLVLRVLDGAGDHPTSSFEEQAEIRYSLGEGPGLPDQTWSHVQIAVEGTRPDQIAMLVDGRRVERTPGLTRLTGALSSQSDTIQVESTEGFPDKCVLRIGDELIEAHKNGETSFRAKFESIGENAGFGGRIAREPFAGYPEMNQGLFKSVDHPAGATVQLYGYSLPIFSNVPDVVSALEDELGLFAVGRIDGVVLNGSERTGSAMEPIVYPGDFGPFDIGHGIDGLGGEDELTGLMLTSADPGRPIEDTMKAFSTTGGYAAILGIPWRDGAPDVQAKDINGTRLGGVEVVRYSGWSGRTLNIVQRGGGGLKKVQGAGVHPDVAGRAAFIVSYGTAATFDEEWLGHDQELSYQVMVIPISIPVSGSAGGTGFDPANNGSAFAQITQSGANSHLTEWVRYDEISDEGFLVRDDSNALLDANRAAHAGREGGDDTPDPRPGQPGYSMLLPEPAPVAKTARAARRPPAASPQQGGNSYWFHAMGEPEDEDFIVARAVNSQFQFRGVLGTYQHSQPAGTMVLPVFRTRTTDVTGGMPGRFDSVMFMSNAPEQPGFEGVVHHAHNPRDFLAYSWDDNGSLEPVEIEEPAAVPQSGFVTSLIHVALDDRLRVPFAPDSIVDANANPIDNRLLSRMVLFPSGELPREIQKGQLGGSAVGGGQRGPAGVPSATVDEALFFPSFSASIVSMPGQLILAQAFDEGDETFTALKDTLRTTLGDTVLDDPASADPKEGGKLPPGSALALDPLANLPPHGGLLRIGDELLCYDSYDRGQNVYTFTIPPAGRGLLGTEPQPHRPTEGISYVGSLPLGILGANVDADDSVLALLEAPAGFPAHGLVRIDDELVHYSGTQGALLEMPRGSVEPGAMDRKGPGLFRGRFGTERASHAAGTPVILFPFRYWDRWSENADVPELTWYGLDCDQPDAFWKRVFWKSGDAGHPGPELGVLQRTNEETPWDARPEGDNGLTLLWNGKIEGEGNPIGVQADRVEWRIFVRHQRGSFDPLLGLAHGWKTTPRLELFGVEYMGPNRTLARVDR